MLARLLFLLNKEVYVDDAPGKPDDVVQLAGSLRKGRVLDWKTQLPIDQRQLSATHVAIQPIDQAGEERGPIVFWPRLSLLLLNRKITIVDLGIDDDFDFRC